MITGAQRKCFENAGYRVVGRHSLVKVCDWTKKALCDKNVCYKCTFYGIQSWRCVEMSPTWLCNHKCVFCWRDTKQAWPKWFGPVDEPKEIVDGCINEWKKLIQGFKGNPKANKQKFTEALNPKHFAISLIGEPCLYPRLPELVDEIKARGMTAFLVTNGTIPGMLKKLLKHQPTQLYITLPAPDKQTYLRISKPLQKNGWEKLQSSLKLLKKFNRGVVRLTLVKGWNIHSPEKYAALITKTKPRFVELKGYSHTGYSKERLDYDAVPTHEEILRFAKQICALTNLKIIAQKPESLAVLLAKNSKGRMLELG